MRTATFVLTVCLMWCGQTVTILPLDLFTLKPGVFERNCMGDAIDWLQIILRFEDAQLLENPTDLPPEYHIYQCHSGVWRINRPPSRHCSQRPNEHNWQESFLYRYEIHSRPRERVYGFSDEFFDSLYLITSHRGSHRSINGWPFNPGLSQLQKFGPG